MISNNESISPNAEDNLNTTTVLKDLYGRNMGEKRKWIYGDYAVPNATRYIGSYPILYFHTSNMNLTLLSVSSKA